MSEEKVAQFLAVVGDELDRATALKFVEWGKGDLNQALNYYYRHKEKNMLKVRPPPDPLLSKVHSVMAEGRLQQSKKLRAIRELREKYLQPVKTTLQGQDQANTTTSLFSSVDYLPSVFSQHKPTNLPAQPKLQAAVDFRPAPQEKQSKSFPSSRVTPASLKRTREQISQPPKLLSQRGLVYAGSARIKTLSRKPADLTGILKGTALQLRLQGSLIGAAKRKKSKRSEDSCIYALAGDKEISRFEDQLSQILLPLLWRGLIRVGGGLCYDLGRVDYFSPIYFDMQVYFTPAAFTKPVVDSFQNTFTEAKDLKQFGQVRSQLKRLFDLIDTEWVVESLISVKCQPAQSSEPRKTKPKQSEPKADSFNPFAGQESKIEQFLKLEERGCSYNLSEPSREYFRSELHQYQKQALTWMLYREGVDNGYSILQRDLHPLWAMLRSTAGHQFYFNSFSGQLSAEKPPRLQDCRGGILSDEMGLGKTVMALSLIATNRGKQPRGTLIVVPMSLLGQWADEVRSHCNGLSVSRYYGVDRSHSDLTGDVVLTTYGTLARQFANELHVSRKGLFGSDWHRVVLDEAHLIRGRVIQCARAAFQLKSKHRWCITGTPIQNQLDDLFALIHFIRLVPWSNFNWWTAYISKPFAQQDQSAADLLSQILQPVMLRRTKTSLDSKGQLIIKLPPRHERIRPVELSQEERQFYEAVREKASQTLQAFEKKGALLAKYMNVLELLVKLQQICCHPSLFRTTHNQPNFTNFQKTFTKFVEKRLAQTADEGIEFEPEDNDAQSVPVVQLSSAYVKQTLKQIQLKEQFNCVVCLSGLSDPVITVCAHVACKPCLQRTLQTTGRCPSCRRGLTREDFMNLPAENRLKLDLAGQYIRSSKITAIMEELQRCQPQDKVVLFTQFLGMMDLLQHEFKTQGVKFVRLDGSTSQSEREQVLQRFRTDPSIKIFLISLMAGGVGLNLVAANKVYMVNSWWNPAVQDQAVERVHRIGQERGVQIVKFVVRDSVEDRMQQVHHNKRGIMKLCTGGARQQVDLQTIKYLMRKYD